MVVTHGIAPLRPPILGPREWALVEELNTRAQECLQRNNMPGFVAWSGASQLVQTRLAAVDIDLCGPETFEVSTR